MKGIPLLSLRVSHVWVFLLATASVRGQGLEFPRVEPDPAALSFATAYSAGGGNADLYLGAALWASGAQAGSAEERIRAAVMELTNLDLPSSKGERAEAVLSFMHRRFLRRYEERQTRLDVLVLSGTYNCVSSAVLYLILGTAVGLDVAGVVTRDHALCTVGTEAGRLDVETTSPYGFDPGTRREFLDEFGAVTGFSYVPPRNYRDRNPVGALELISLILSNRIVEAEATGRFGAAVEMAVDRLSLLSLRFGAAEAPLFGDPRRELMDRLLNFGAALARAGNEELALDWSSRASGYFGPDPRWFDFIYSALNNRIVRLLRAEKIVEARAALEKRGGTLGERPRWELERLVTDAELVSLVESIPRMASPEQGYRAVADAEGRGAVTGGRASELRSFIALGEAERATDHRAAIASLESSIARFGRLPRLEEARRVYRSNRIAELHNRFAQLFNRRSFSEARDAALAALEEFPQERRFLYNLELINRALRTESN